MSQYDNPFTGTPLGWDDGESGWGEPLNTTLLQTAFYHNRNIDGVLATVSLLPVSPANGVAYLVEENLRVYFRSNSVWSYSVPPENMVFTVKTTGVKYKKDGAAFVIDTTGEFSGDATEITTGILSTSRTPAFTGDVTKPEGSGVQTLVASGVSAGSYGTSTEIPVITLDVKGRATLASTVAIPDATAGVKGLMTAAAMTKLNGIATGAEVNVNADWNSVSGDSQILNKPTLGTAASATLTISTTDDTTGRVLRVGDFGWGKTAISINQAALDSTSSRATGLYTVTIYTSGVVSIATPSPVWHLDVSANYACQWLHALPTFAGGNDGHVYYRDRTGAVWAPWKEVWTSNTQLSLGTTATSAKTVLALENVNNTSDSVKNSAVATLTNKTINGASNTLTNIAQSSVTNLVSDLGLRAPLASPTFTGTVVLPTTTSIGSVVSAEIGYLAGVSSAIQTQLNNKQPLSTPLTNTTAAFTTALETKLNGIATGAEVNVNADWNSVSGDSQIFNKPTLGTAAAATLTTSSIDTTAGRVLKVGDFGIGTSSVNVADFTSTEVNVGRIFRSLTGATGGAGISGGTISLPYDGSPSTTFLHVGIDYRVYAGIKVGASATPIWLATLNNNDKTVHPTDTTSGRLWRTNDLVKTTSYSDTTSGRVLTVGSHGLGLLQNFAEVQDYSTGAQISAQPNSFVRNVGNVGTMTSIYGVPFSATGLKLAYNTARGAILFTSIGLSSPRVGIVASQSDDSYVPFTEFWTDKNLVKTTSSTDNTSGRMLKVGDFGIGTDNLPSVANGAALDALSATGTYSMAAYTSGVISVAYSCPVIHISRGSNSATQIYFETDVNRLYTRSKAGAVWSAWVELKTSANILNIGTTASSARTALGLATISTSASASDITTGTLSSTRLPFNYTAVNTPNTVMARDGSGNVSAQGFFGDGGNLTGINASNISSGTLATARLPSSSTSASGIVQLNDTTSSTSTTLAATANAVKTVNDSLTSLVNTPKQTFQNIGSGSGARSITAASGMHVIATASGNTTWTFPSPSATEAHALTLELTNGGAFTMTWPASTRWAGGVAPTLTASGTDILVFTKTGTSNWRGYLSSKDSK
jgi:hypothetical protein